jgi:hypothetical protein
MHQEIFIPVSGPEEARQVQALNHAPTTKVECEVESIRLRVGHLEVLKYGNDVSILVDGNRLRGVTRLLVAMDATKAPVVTFEMLPMDFPAGVYRPTPTGVDEQYHQGR